MPSHEPLGLVVESVAIRHDEATSDTPSDASLRVDRGEVVLLLGPSGCGKSTLALALNGLIPHAVDARLSGRILVDGIDTTTTSVARLSEHVAMVFQDPDAQIVTGTLLDEVSFGPENLLVPRPDVLERAEAALRRVGLWERRDENPDRLSGGGKQRLAIACALAMRTATIVLDEPTANLDPVGIVEVYSALRELAATGDHGIVLVEHNLDACVDIVDRVVVLDAHGRSVMHGSVHEILGERVDELLELGVWVPNAALAALALRAAGVDLDPLPLSPAALTAALDGVRLPPSPAELAQTSATTGARARASAPASASASAPAPASAPPPAREASPAPAVSVSDLTVRRGRTEVLHSVSLDLAPGSFTAIVGVNGAGKTTLLQSIAGVVRAPKGRILVGGLDPATADVRSLARAVGFVFQNPEHQFIRTTVEEELRHGLELQKVDEPQIVSRVDDMLTRLGLEELRERHPFLLSGGQKRRLSVATALIAGAGVLALDEPTFGQDRERAAELLGILASLNALGTTVVVVTHDMQLVADYTSHVAVMSDGRILSHAPTAAVLAGDTLRDAGLLPPPLALAMRSLTNHPEWRAVTSLAQLRRLAPENAR